MRKLQKLLILRHGLQRPLKCFLKDYLYIYSFQSTNDLVVDYGIHGSYISKHKGVLQTLGVIILSITKTVIKVKMFHSYAYE
jgi:hypothetical protein